MKDLKKIAANALAFNAHLDEIFVTSDGVPFPDKKDAVNHVKNLDDKAIEKFSRVTEVGETQEQPALPPKDIIVLIEKAESEEAVNQILASDERKTVIAAAQKQIALIKQKALDAQAAAADEANNNRQNQNPNPATTPENE